MPWTERDPDHGRDADGPPAAKRHPHSRPSRLSSGGLVLLATLAALLVASAGIAWWAWSELGAVEISRHGLIALALGAIVSFLVGAGLMTLLFVSSRRGYDDRAREVEDTIRRRREGRH